MSRPYFETAEVGKKLFSKRLGLAERDGLGVHVVGLAEVLQEAAVQQEALLAVGRLARPHVQDAGLGVVGVLKETQRSVKETSV